VIPDELSKQFAELRVARESEAIDHERGRVCRSIEGEMFLIIMHVFGNTKTEKNLSS